MADSTQQETNAKAGENVGSGNDHLAARENDNPTTSPQDVQKEIEPQPGMSEPGAVENEEEEDKDTESGSSRQKVDGADEDRSVDATVKDDKVQRQNNMAIGVELVNGTTKELDANNVSSPLGADSKEKKWLNEVQGATRLCSERTETEDDTGLELVTEMETKAEWGNALAGVEVGTTNELAGKLANTEQSVQREPEMKPATNMSILDKNDFLMDEPETEEDQAAFMKELEVFHKVKCLEFKPPKFYGEPLNCLKLWKAVIRLGGYEQVTACKLWRQVGESFNPPKTCTTVSWTFRGFYEKALLEYEKHKMRNGELPFNDASFAESSSVGNQPGLSQASGSGRARRDAAARAMQGWHTQRLLGNGEVGDPIIKEKNSVSTPKREKQLKSVGLLKRKKLSPVDHPLEVARHKASKLQLETVVVDIGPPADWVKINVQRTKDCFEVYALVPGLLREEVRVQSDPAGRLVITGQPEQVDNPWGVTPFKKVVSLPSRIDPHQTSAVVTLHGQLFVRVPFEQSEM